MSSEQLILAHIQERFAPHLRAGDLQVDTPLLDQGVLRSIDVVQLVLFLEETFRVRIRPRDITPENFGTSQRIAELVERKVAAA